MRAWNQSIERETCLIPCQWMTTPSVWSLFVSWTWTISPALARIVGPGNWSLIPITTFSTPSGDQYMYATSHLWKWCPVLLEVANEHWIIYGKIHQIMRPLKLLENGSTIFSCWISKRFVVWWLMCGGCHWCPVVQNIYRGSGRTPWSITLSYKSLSS